MPVREKGKLVSSVCLYVDPFLNLITPFGHIQNLADRGAYHTPSRICGG